MKKILIIDYDQNSLATLQGALSSQGYQVVTAGDGQTGWDKYNKESPDLVLMEAMLPKVHGFELCQRITSERNSQATVFIMTGVYKDRVYRTEALRTYGASEYFEKPLKMAELMASVEAVLGKPEARPAPQPQAPTHAPVMAQTAREIRPEPAAAKREKSRSDDSMFSLPDDLDRLSREIPKVHKPAAPRPEPAADSGFEAIADQLLKTVIVESATAKTVSPKAAGGNGNGNGNGGGSADIDQFLRSALAGLDLNKDKVRAARPAAPPAPPVKDKPAPPAVRPAPPEVKPAPPEIKPAPPKPPTPPAPPAPAKSFAAPETRPAPPVKSFTPPATTDMKNTLTPGDPGSDVSPFFTPETSRPFEKVERKPVPSPVRHEAPKAEPVRPKPEKSEPVRPAPAPPEPVKKEAHVIASAGIFQDIAEPSEKKGFPKLVAIGLGIIAVAAVGFILLRPKRPAPVAPPPQEPAVTTTSSETTSQPVEEVQPPVAKPAPVKQKAQPQAKPAETGASAILPAETASLTLPPPGTNLKASPDGGPAAPGPGTAPASDPAAKTSEAGQPAVKTGTGSSQNQTAPAGGITEPAPSPAAIPVKEGDLVELGAVTEPPRLVKKIEPVYPSAAQRVGREGNITVNALIDEKGNVIDTGILKGIQDDKGLGRAAEIAVRKWKFQPARKGGVAVKVWKSFIIAFKAEANTAT